VNSAVKRLLLSFAFDTLGLNRVQLKADARNARSRGRSSVWRAVRGNPAGAHGAARRFVRDSALYALTRADWTSSGQGDRVRQGRERVTGGSVSPRVQFPRKLRAYPA
jgi:hypothetical protein